MHSPPNQLPTKAKKPTGAPTPPASASTPVARAPTPSPAAASPQIPKSPKSKLPAKKQPKSRKPSTPKVNATPTIEPAPIPDPSTTAGAKKSLRLRLPSVFPAPLQDLVLTLCLLQWITNLHHLKVKTDWEGPVSESLQKKNQEVLWV